MLKKIALCAMLILILVPVSVIAAGPQGKETPTGMKIGNSQLGSRLLAGETTGQQGYGIVSSRGNGQMLQTRSHDQDHDVLRDMTRNQTRLGSGAGPCMANGTANGPSLTSQQSGQMVLTQNRFSEQFRVQQSGANLSGIQDQQRDRTRDMVRDMIRNQTRLMDGSCGDCERC